MAETEPVTFNVQLIEPASGAGRLVALAIVAMEIAGVEVVLQGVQIIRGPNGRASVEAPKFRHPRTGQWIPAVVLPPELRDAIGRELLACLPDVFKDAKGMGKSLQGIQPVGTA